MTELSDLQVTLPFTHGARKWTLTWKHDRQGFLSLRGADRKHDISSDASGRLRCSHITHELMWAIYNAKCAFQRTSELAWVGVFNASQVRRENPAPGPQLEHYGAYRDDLNGPYWVRRRDLLLVLDLMGWIITAETPDGRFCYVNRKKKKDA